MKTKTFVWEYQKEYSPERETLEAFLERLGDEGWGIISLVADEYVAGDGHLLRLNRLVLICVKP